MATAAAAMPKARLAADAGSVASDPRAVAIGSTITVASTLPDAGGAMLIRNGRASVQVSRLDDAVARLRRTSLSSLEIALHEPMSVRDQRGPSPIAEAFADAWRRAIGVVAWCIAFLGVLVPLGLLVGMLVVGRRLPGLKRVSTSS